MRRFLPIAFTILLLSPVVLSPLFAIFVMQHAYKQSPIPQQADGVECVVGKGAIASVTVACPPFSESLVPPIRLVHGGSPRADREIIAPELLMPGFDETFTGQQFIQPLAPISLP